ncbi:MAG: DUF4236 domain-containing protein [Gemmobacter sp.]|nr:DUF4236 domain-containing protein [Gemmobacter sp.]
MRELKIRYIIIGSATPLYIKNSLNLGPFRINLLKSGLGLSAGVKGLGLGTGPKGHYIHAGRSGIYYRKTLDGLGRKPKTTRLDDRTDYTSEIVKIAPNEKLPTYITEDGVPMRRIISAEMEVLIAKSHSEALRSLNEARGRPSITLMLCGAAAIGLAISFTAQIPVGVAVFAILLLLACATGRLIDAPRRNVVFAYDPEPIAEERYKALIDAIDSIANADKIWFVKASGDITDLHIWKKNSGASTLVDTKETAVSYALPAGIASNVVPPMIGIDGKNCYFFPDCILIDENKRFGAMRYGTLRTAIRNQRMIMESAPVDATVVGQTWKYVNKNGNPDHRFNSNRQLPICLFEEIGMVSDGGFKGLLQVSKHGIGNACGAAISDLGRVTNELKDADPLLITKEA